MLPNETTVECSICGTYNNKKYVCLDCYNKLKSNKKLIEAHKIIIAKVFESLTPAEQDAILKYFQLIVTYNAMAEELLKILEVKR